MVPIKAFMCSDGTLKNSEYEAYRYDCVLGLKEIFNKNMGMLGGSGNGVTMTAGQAAAILNNKFKDFLNVWNECEKKLNKMAQLQRRRENAKRRAEKLQQGNELTSVDMSV